MEKIKLIVFIILLTVVIIPQKLKAPINNIIETKKNTENYITFKQEHELFLFELNEFNRFLDDIAKRESGGNWKIYNKFGYIGLYQFGRAALIDVGYNEITFNKFISNPYIFPITKQNLVMVKYLHKNKTQHLNHIIDMVTNKDIVLRGVKVTRSGVLAGAHIGGVRGVRNLMLYDIDKADAFGTRISDYVIEFSGYDFSVDVMTHVIDSLETELRKELII